MAALSTAANGHRTSSISMEPPSILLPVDLMAASGFLNTGDGSWGSTLLLVMQIVVRVNELKLNSVIGIFYH